MCPLLTENRLHVKIEEHYRAWQKKGQNNDQMHEQKVAKQAVIMF